MIRYPRRDIKSSYNTDFKSMTASDKKFFFLNFFVEVLALSHFPSNIIANVSDLREIIIACEDYSPIKVGTIIDIYYKTQNWTKDFATIYGYCEVSSKVHKLEHFVIEVILVIFFFDS